MKVHFISFLYAIGKELLQYFFTGSLSCDAGESDAYQRPELESESVLNWNGQRSA